MGMAVSLTLDTSPICFLTQPPFFEKYNFKGLLKTLRRKWLKGPYSKFDKLLSQIAKCDLETAREIREKWLELEFLAYDQQGFLVWYTVRF